MVLIDPLWDALEDEVDYEKPILEREYEVKGKIKRKSERSGNNLIIIRYSEFYNLLAI